METTGNDDAQGEFLAAGFLIAGRYEVVDVLGTGGMGSVYLAKDRVLAGEYVAVKILHRQFAYEQKYTQRFLREVQLMRKINNKNVVRTYDLGADGDIVYFTMEYVPGESLCSIIEKHIFQKEQLPKLIIQICEGLAAVHEVNIIHRDLKPGNILFADENTVKLTDFGVARPEASDLTAHNEVIGSSSYMAPEVWLGEPLTHAVDLYSLGVILYELATGVLPFDGDSPAALMRQHLDRTPPPPEQINKSVPIWLNKLIMSLLEKAPDNRPESAREVIETVEEALALKRSSMNTSQSVSNSFIGQLERISKRAADVNATSVYGQDTRRIEPRFFSSRFKIPSKGVSISRLLDANSIISISPKTLAEIGKSLSVMAATLLFLLTASNLLAVQFTTPPEIVFVQSEGAYSLKPPAHAQNWGAFIAEHIGAMSVTLLILSIPALVISACSFSLTIIFRTFLVVASFFLISGTALLTKHIWPILKHGSVDISSLTQAGAATKLQLTQLSMLSPFFSIWDKPIVLNEGMQINFAAVHLQSFLTSPLFFILITLYLALLSYVAHGTLSKRLNRPQLAFPIFGFGLFVLLFLEAALAPSSNLARLIPLEKLTLWSWSFELPTALPIPFAFNWVFAYLILAVVIPLVKDTKKKR